MALITLSCSRFDWATVVEDDNASRNAALWWVGRGVHSEGGIRSVRREGDSHKRGNIDNVRGAIYMGLDEGD